MEYLSCVEIEPKEKAEASVIWLHGLGANGHDFEPMVPELGLGENTPVRFIFPHAPEIPVSINNRMKMPAWYDITDLDLGRQIDQAQLQQSSKEIEKLIARENERGVPSQKIIIAGFSQGGAVGYEIALSYQNTLAGLIALSTYFATKEMILYSTANKSLPIFIGHGNHDQMVSSNLSVSAYELLKEKKYPVEYHLYEVAHGVNMQEIRDVGIWISKILGLE